LKGATVFIEAVCLTNLENVNLIRDGAPFFMAANLVLQNGAGLLLVILGMLSIRLLVK